MRTIDEIRKDILALTSELDMVKLQLDTERRVAEKSFKREYDYAVEVKIHEDTGRWGWDDIPDRTETIYLSRLPSDKCVMEHAALDAKFGNLSIMLPDHPEGMRYYRFHGVVIHSGGGTCILKQPLYLTDEEWDLLKSGVVKKEWLINEL